MGKAGKRSNWIIDSGASCHMTWEKELFYEYKELSGSSMKLGDGRTFEAVGEGTMKVSVYRGDGNSTHSVCITFCTYQSCHVISCRYDRSLIVDSI